MERKMSTEFKKARREMIERKTKCHECEDYAMELHHVIAVEDGGTDEIENLPVVKATRVMTQFELWLSGKVIWLRHVQLLRPL